MAATRLIALHINKGKSIAQTLSERTDYSKNEEKTDGGKYISSYECDARTADEEFLLSKRQYEYMTGRRQEHDVIAYQIRQSFKPGEVTPEEANRIGYELGMRFTKGKHAFIVATHTDRATSTTTSFSIPPPWTAPGSSGISFYPGWLSNGSATGCVWSMAFPS